jgi:hypothetical protein
VVWTLSTLKSAFSAWCGWLAPLFLPYTNSLWARGPNDMTTAEQSSDGGCCFVRGTFLVIGVLARGRSGGAAVGAFGAVVPGEVYTEGGAVMVGVQSEADQAFLGPEALSRSAGHVNTDPAY